MNTFYFIHRNVGSDPDTSKYYFSSIGELLNLLPNLKTVESRNNFIKWAASKSDHNDNKYTLMSDYWTYERQGTDTPLNVKVGGYTDISIQMKLIHLFITFFQNGELTIQITSSNVDTCRQQTSQTCLP